MLDFHDLSDVQFEKIVVLICKRILGVATIEFTAGADGGRDAKFVGTAQLFPSKVAPWMGKIIIQAKHTFSNSASFSDPDFFENQSSLLNLEIPKIKKLFDEDSLSHYILFSNRRLTGNFEEKIRRYIEKETGVLYENIAIIGVDDLHDYCRICRDEVDEYLEGGYHLDMPFVYDPRDIADIIDGILYSLDDLNTSVFTPPTSRLSYEEKNKLNAVDDDIANYLRKRYLEYTSKLEQFLADPINQKYAEKYENIIDALQRKIIIYQKDGEDFSKILDKLFDILDGRITKNKKLGRAIIFYMYWNCDIGKVS